jgi:hypothetical protein
LGFLGKNKYVKHNPIDPKNPDVWQGIAYDENGEPIYYSDEEIAEMKRMK